MRNRKWLIPLCAGAVALLLGLVLLLTLTPRVSLHDFACSLTNGSLFVCNDGSVWQAQEGAFVSGEELIPTGVWAPWYVERGAMGEDRDLPAWGFALRMGVNKVFIRSDGSLWLTYSSQFRESRVLPFMEEVTAEPTGAEGLELRDFMLQPYDSYLHTPDRLLFTATSENKPGGFTARLSVLLKGHWYSVTRTKKSAGPLGAETKDGTLFTYFSLSFWDVPGWGGEPITAPGVVPGGVYRVELWGGNTLLRTRAFLYERLSGGRVMMNTDEQAIRAWLDG